MPSACRTTATLLATALLAACGGGGSSGSSPSADDPNLPSGLPAGSNDDRIPELQPVSSAIPESQRLSTGGFDSTHPDWDYYRTLPSTGTTGLESEKCRWLITAMLSDRGLAEDQTEDSVSPQTWWYWSQGYTVTFDWTSDEECQGEDYRFAPQF